MESSTTSIGDRNMVNWAVGIAVVGTGVAKVAEGLAGSLVA